MAQVIKVHPANPQQRAITTAADILRAGGVMAYPTDSSYALGCLAGDTAAMERIRAVRRSDKHHNMTLVCRDLAEIATYARVDNPTYRLLRAHTPGPYTFILPATREVPRRLQHTKRRTIGIRVPGVAVVNALLDELASPLLSSTLLLPGESVPLNTAEEIEARIGTQIEVIVDAGPCGLEPTTVVVCEVNGLTIARYGKGDPAPFEHR